MISILPVSVENPVDIVKAYSLTNLSFLVTSISNFKNYIDNASYHMNNLNSIKGRISASNTTTVTSEDIEMINGVAQEFFSKDLMKEYNIQRYETLSYKLERLWIILQEIYETGGEENSSI